MVGRMNEARRPQGPELCAAARVLWPSRRTRRDIPVPAAAYTNDREWAAKRGRDKRRAAAMVLGGRREGEPKRGAARSSPHYAICCCCRRARLMKLSTFLYIRHLIPAVGGACARSNPALLDLETRGSGARVLRNSSLDFAVGRLMPAVHVESADE
jgi:hypothetical protein